MISFAGITRSKRAARAAHVSHRHPKVAYLMSRFPKLTETFILYEMLAVEQQGVQIALYPLMRDARP